MKTEVQKVGACRVKLSVEATAEEIDPIYKGVRSAFTAQVKLPGFRPGKAPWERIEKLYGKGIQDEVNKRVVRKLMEAREEAKVRIAALVDVEQLKSAKGEGASATFVIDVEPEFKTPDTKKWQVKKIDDTVTDEEVQTRLNEVRRMAASFREATADDVSTADDLVAIAFSSDLDKETLSDAAKHYAADDEYWVQLREDAFIPGLKDALTGKKLGETVEFSAQYAKDFRLTDLAGKDVKYTVTLKSMRKLTPADDAAVVARFGVKDMDELKGSVTENLKASKKYAEEQRASKELCEAIEASVKFDLPERVLDERIYDELSMDPSKPLETFKGDAEALKKSDVYKAAADRAAKTLRRTYVLLRLAEEREIKLTSEEMEAALDRLSQATGLKRPELMRRLVDNGRMDEFMERELASKMLGELLKECATL